MEEREKQLRMTKTMRTLRSAVEKIEEIAIDYESFAAGLEITIDRKDLAAALEEIKNHVSPAEPREENELYLCPRCGIPFGTIKDIGEMIELKLWYTHCCRFCGQALKWK